MSDQSNINKLTDSISKLKTAIDEYSSAVERKIAELKNAKSSAEFTIAQSEEEQQKIKGAIEITNVEKVKLERDLNQKQDELNTAIAENANIGNALDIATKSFNLTDNVLKIAVDSLEETHSKIRELHETIANQEREASDLRNQLQRERDLATQANINNNRKIFNKNQEIADKDSQIRAIQFENDTLSERQKTQIANLEREKTALEQQKTGLEAQTADLLKSNTEEIQKKDELISKLETEYKSKEAELEESIENLKLENEKAANNLDQLQSKLEESTKLTAEEKENNKKLLGEIDEKQNELDKQLADIEKVNEVITNIHTNITNLQTNQEALTKQHSNCQSKIAELNKQIEQANSKINELQKIVEGKTSVLNANDDDNFGVDITGVAPEPVLYTEPTLVKGQNGETKIQLKDKLNNKIIDFPYDAETGLPKNDVDGSITGFITKWSKTTRQDGSTVYTKESVKKNNKTNKIEKNFTVKGGRKRKASKTIKNTIKKHVSNKRNTKRKNKLHKKQTYRR